jgi:hypothetical protein
MVVGLFVLFSEREKITVTNESPETGKIVKHRFFGTAALLIVQPTNPSSVLKFKRELKMLICYK